MLEIRRTDLEAFQRHRTGRNRSAFVQARQTPKNAIHLARKGRESLQCRNRPAISLAIQYKRRFLRLLKGYAGDRLGVEGQDLLVTGNTADTRARPSEERSQDQLYTQHSTQKANESIHGLFAP